MNSDEKAHEWGATLFYLAFKEHKGLSLISQYIKDERHMYQIPHYPLK